jgi:broad specificity phosphatase PhoE
MPKSRLESATTPRVVTDLKVLAIRHGETAWSLNGRRTGTTDIPLTDNGRRLAERMRPQLSKVAFACSRQSNAAGAGNLRARRARRQGHYR